MKTHYAIALAVAGVAVGGLAVEGLHAQAKPPAYYVAEVNVANEDVYSKEWAPKVAETMKAAGGTYIARGTNIQGFDGTAPKRVVIMKWDNMDKLKAWREGAAYKALAPIREKAIKSTTAYAIEGATN